MLHPNVHFPCIRVWTPRSLLQGPPCPFGTAPCRLRWGVLGPGVPRLRARASPPPGSAGSSSTPGARQAPGPPLSGQRDPPIGALGPALGRWILAPHTHRAALPRFAARADWLQYRTPKPNQRLQPPLPPPLPLPSKMANSNKGGLGPPSNRLRAGAPEATPPPRPRPQAEGALRRRLLGPRPQLRNWHRPGRKEYAGAFPLRRFLPLKHPPKRSYYAGANSPPPEPPPLPFQGIPHLVRWRNIHTRTLLGLMRKRSDPFSVYACPAGRREPGGRNLAPEVQQP